MTRADHPIQVEVEVSGLYDSVADLSFLPEAFRQALSEVRLEVYSETYADGQNSLPESGVTSDAHTELALVGNGNFPRNSNAGQDWVPYTGLSRDAPDLARGEERFVVRSLRRLGQPSGTVSLTVAVAMLSGWSL